MKNDEKGQALVIVLVLVAFGGVVITPFLGNAGDSLIGSRIYREAISQQYSSDAGVEHAIWDLTYGDLIQQINDSGDNTTTYQLGEEINSITPEITVTRTDNFTYEITSMADNETIQAIVDIAGANVRINQWRINP
jgi:hypothetical protein